MPLQPVRASFRAQRQAAQVRNYQAQMFPAPTRGIDVASALTDMDPRGALQQENLFTRRYGPELRPGYLRWITNLGGALTPKRVLTMMAYNPPRGTGSVFVARLFAACDDGNIYEVTGPQNEVFVPVAAVNIPGQLNPGVFSYTNFATLATNFLCICSAGGGYWTFDHVGGWVNRTGAIAGPGAPFAVNFDFIMSWKNRLWFIVNNTSDTYFLPTNSIAGNASNFDFGPLLNHGGELKAMASWTMDGGSGIDDKLVLVGDGGDVLVYEGTDPAGAGTFRIVGKWFVGRPPAGRRFMSKYGGDCAILCENGVEYMSRVLQAMGLIDPEKQDITPQRRYNSVIGKDIKATRLQEFWQMIFLPSEESVIVLTPYHDGTKSKQHIFSPLAQGWSQFKNMPMLSAEVFNGDLYFGTVDGRVCKAFYGTTDDVLSTGAPGAEVVGTVQTAFLAPENDRISLKRPQLINPMFQAPMAPKILAEINTEWDFTGIPGSPSYLDEAGGVWNQDFWNECVWSGSTGTYMGWIGAMGLGSYVSLRMKITGPPRTTFVSWKYSYEGNGNIM